MAWKYKSVIVSIQLSLPGSDKIIKLKLFVGERLRESHAFKND